MSGSLLFKITFVLFVSRVINMAKFGFHRDALIGNDRVGITRDDMYVERFDPEKHSDKGIVCSALPLRGNALFEVEVSVFGIGCNRDFKKRWGWSLAVGIYQVATDHDRLTTFGLPRKFEFGTGRRIVWTRQELLNKLDYEGMSVTKYGQMSLSDLMTGDRVGIKVERNGNLSFLLNRENQGLAANNVYLEGYETFAIIDMNGDCYGARVIRAETEIAIGRQLSTFRIPKVSEPVDPDIDHLQFGFNSVTGNKVLLSNNNMLAQRIEPDKNSDSAVVYGAQPIGLMGWFEVEIVESNDNWSTDSVEMYHTLGLGVVRCARGHVLTTSDVPSRAYLGENHCVWWGNSIWNRFLPNVASSDSNTHTPMDFNDLRKGDKVGLRIARNGSLMFYVNGKCQGFMTPTEDLYDQNYDYYPLIDIGGSYTAVKVIRAEIGAKYLNLQELCIEKIVCSLRSPKYTWQLRRLPEHLRYRIERYYLEELKVLEIKEEGDLEKSNDD